MTNRRAVFVVSEKQTSDGLRSFWTRVGSAFDNRDGSVTLKLDALPLSGTLQVRDGDEREDAAHRVATERQACSLINDLVGAVARLAEANFGTSRNFSDAAEARVTAAKGALLAFVMGGAPAVDVAAALGGISADPAVMNGAPCVRGTRVPVVTVLGMLAEALVAKQAVIDAALDAEAKAVALPVEPEREEPVVAAAYHVELTDECPF